MKTHVEPTIRDIPSLLALAPWYGKKHRDNTLTMKRFTNGRGFWCLGGKAAKNYREKSVDVAGYDELAAFDDDIEQEGSPTFLGDKRIEGSVWPKSIRGSTPKVRGTCQIERAASESPHFMRFHVACPHCGEEQYLKFGDKETPFGLKWTPDDPSSVFYLCEHNACVIRQQELDFTDARYICEKTGIWTRDGILWFSSSGEEIEPPDSVTFHIWTAYSPFTTWVQIVKDWMKTKGDTGKRKTFVNTTLGETWEAKIGERPDAEVMAERKEHYSAPVFVLNFSIPFGIPFYDGGRVIKHLITLATASQNGHSLFLPVLNGTDTRTENVSQLLFVDFHCSFHGQKQRKETTKAQKFVFSTCRFLSFQGVF